MILNLAVQPREIGNKSARKNLRKGGLIPAVIYSEGQPGIPISVPTNEFFKLYKKRINEVSVFNLLLDGKDHHVIVKARQIHPVTREYVHVDFFELKKDKEISLSIPIKFIGVPACLKTGGVLETSLHSLHVTCLPRHIPDNIPLNIEDMKIGDTIYVRDVVVKNLVIQGTAETPIISVNEEKKDTE